MKHLTRTAVCVSGSLWVLGWFALYLEIYRWRHIIPSLHLNGWTAPPGEVIQSRPGGFLIAVLMTSALAPPIFAALVAWKGLGSPQGRFLFAQGDERSFSSRDRPKLIEMARPTGYKRAVTLDRQALARQAAALAEYGVYVGTSSWKDPDWCDTIYDRNRYEYRGKFAEAGFKRDCPLTPDEG
jgi:hypothetical protein